MAPQQSLHCAKIFRVNPQQQGFGAPAKSPLGIAEQGQRTRVDIDFVGVQTLISQATAHMLQRQIETCTKPGQIGQRPVPLRTDGSIARTRLRRIVRQIQRCAHDSTQAQYVLHVEQPRFAPGQKTRRA